MIILVLVGGNSQRFLDAGYTTPKCLLPMPDYGTMLDWVMQALPLENNRVVFAARTELFSALEDGIYKSYRILQKARSIEMVWGMDKARGPLYGVLDAREELAHDEPVLVTYCDTIMMFPVSHALSYWHTLHAESGAITFSSQDARYGYWDGKRVVEKQVVGKWAVSGLFYFRNAREMVKRADSLVNMRVAAITEPVAYGMVHLLNEQSKMYPVLPSQILDLGTPEAYRQFMAEGIRA